MLTLASISAAIMWVLSHAWVLFIALIPSVANFVSPLFQAVVNATSEFVRTLWQGVSEAKWPQWVVVLTVGAVAFAVGYHYGWQACIDWVHAHFKLLQKVPFTSWWKFW